VKGELAGVQIRVRLADVRAAQHFCYQLAPANRTRHSQYVVRFPSAGPSLPHLRLTGLSWFGGNGGQSPGTWWKFGLGAAARQLNRPSHIFP
jgi:hypothetical protein